MQIIVYHSKARKTMCGMGTFCLIGMISLQLTIQNGEMELMSKTDCDNSTVWVGNRDHSFAFICYKESKTMQAIFKDGSKVSFKGE